jgi:hypothetical protein
MTQDDVEDGRLVCRIVVAPGAPREFASFRRRRAARRASAR